MYVLTLNRNKSTKIIRFHVKACAEIFQQCLGGQITEE